MTEEEEKFKAHNWKHLTPHEVKNLPPVQRGRYLAYEEPPKDVLDAQEATLKRIRETYKQKKIATRGREPVDLGTFLAFICKISFFCMLPFFGSVLWLPLTKFLYGILATMGGW